MLGGLSNMGWGLGELSQNPFDVSAPTPASTPVASAMATSQPLNAAQWQTPQPTYSSASSAGFPSGQTGSYVPPPAHGTDFLDELPTPGQTSSAPTSYPVQTAGMAFAQPPVGQSPNPSGRGAVSAATLVSPPDIFNRHSTSAIGASAAGQYSAAADAQLLLRATSKPGSVPNGLSLLSAAATDSLDGQDFDDFAEACLRSPIRSLRPAVQRGQPSSNQSRSMRG